MRNINTFNFISRRWLEMVNYTDITFEKKPPIGWVTLNRPDKLNSITSKMIEELNDVMNTLWDDEKIRVLVITGAGDKAFCAGADIPMFQGQKPGGNYPKD
jgi:enoyl-CoA hydratase/3-hydroxyacyl-CoA dehydrogenase